VSRTAQGWSAARGIRGACASGSIAIITDEIGNVVEGHGYDV
jgi:hypothetical protein